MNTVWHHFLRSRNARFETETRIRFPSADLTSERQIYAVAHLATLTVSGLDAAAFLQGQLTCNVQELTASQAHIAALCNAKGRAVATFIIAKTGDAFLLILPVELLETVRQRLGKYVLRADVRLTDSSDDYCLIGLAGVDTGGNALFSIDAQVPLCINLKARKLLIASPEQAVAIWNERLAQGFQPADSCRWRYLDILSGLPWLTTATSEAFVPQMLNLDKLGGISFTKGCYTGQEIIARTHYLGKSKRALLIAEADTPNTPEPYAELFDDRTDAVESAPDANDIEPAKGRVLLAERYDGVCKLLIVALVSDNGAYRLKLANGYPLTVSDIA